MLTPAEILFYKAKLILDITDQKATEIANDLITKMALQKCKNTRVGKVDSAGGLSGGERRRASIAVELVKNPSVLFLDEALSGLDSETINVLMNLFKKMECTIVLVVHQPNQETYEMFDQLLLISHGEALFYGDSKDACGYLESFNYKYDPKMDTSEFIMDCISRKVQIEGEITEEPKEDFEARVNEIKKKHEETY